MIIVSDIWCKKIGQFTFAQLIDAGLTFDDIEDGIDGKIVLGKLRLMPTEDLVQYLDYLDCAHVTRFRAIRKFRETLRERLAE